MYNRPIINRNEMEGSDMKIILSKSQYEAKKEEILNSNLTVSTKSVTSRKKFTHKTTISCELGQLILEINGGSTTYSYVSS